MNLLVACSVGWFVSLLVREEVLLAGLCEKKILFRLKIYNRLRQATVKRTDCQMFLSAGGKIFQETRGRSSERIK